MNQSMTNVLFMVLRLVIGLGDAVGKMNNRGWITGVVMSILLLTTGASANPVIMPVVEKDGAVLELTLVTAKDGQAWYSFLGGGVMLETKSDLIRAKITFQDAGRYSWGISLTTDSLQVADYLQTAYRQGSPAKPVVWRYPYDFTYVGTANVLRQPHLVFPGIRVGDAWYVAETKDLAEVHIVPGTPLKAIFYYTRCFNAGYDQAERVFAVDAGTEFVLEIFIGHSIAEVNAHRFGLPDKMPSQRFGPFYYRGWTGPADPTWYKALAQALQDVYDTIIIRTPEPYGWIAEMLNAHGIDAHFYQYLGGIRKSTPDAMAAEIKGWLLKDSKGKLYSAPNPNGNWVLVDVRKPEVRAYFIAKAVEAIRAGYQGIFFDGYYIWLGSDNRVGGSVPEAEESFVHARWRLLAEVKEAVHAVNPHAKVGILAGQWYDLLGEADYVLKENYYSDWVDQPTTPWDRSVQVSKSKADEYVQQMEPWISANLVKGTKGMNPLAVSFIAQAGDLVFTEPGDFFTEHLEHWLRIMSDLASYDDVQIAGHTPHTAKLLFKGLSQLKTDVVTNLSLTQPTVALIKETGEIIGPTKEFVLQPSQTYLIAERKGESGWLWTAEGFAYYNDLLHGTGNVWLTADPKFQQNRLELQYVNLAVNTVFTWQVPKMPTAVWFDGKLLDYGDTSSGWQSVAGTLEIRTTSSVLRQHHLVIEL